jgi:hypothetical protein
MELQRREVEAISRAVAPPTFENTIVALEDAGRASSWPRTTSAPTRRRRAGDREVDG